MIRFRVLTAFVLMLLATVGFMSLPAYSGENPWDADGREGGTDVDTTWQPPGDLVVTERESTAGSSDWMSKLSFGITFFMVDFYAEHFGSEGNAGASTNGDRAESRSKVTESKLKIR